MRPRTTGSPDRPARPPAPAVFGEAELEGLPGPARRYLRASIAPGTPLATSARLRMRGRIKVGRWLPFHARQVLEPESSFQWTARASGVLSGFDRYADGQGEMCWKLLGLLPVMRAAGPDVTRSAAGRAAAEAIWLPTTLLPQFGICWRALDDQYRVARRNVGDVQIEAHYRVDARRPPHLGGVRPLGRPLAHGDLGPAPIRRRDHGVPHLHRPLHPQRRPLRLVLQHRAMARRRVLPLRDHRTPPNGVTPRATGDAAGRQTRFRLAEYRSSEGPHVKGRATRARVER